MTSFCVCDEQVRREECIALELAYSQRLKSIHAIEIGKKHTVTRDGRGVSDVYDTRFHLSAYFEDRSRLVSLFWNPLVTSTLGFDAMVDPLLANLVAYV